MQEAQTERHSAIVIGAGQSGLAAGYYLAARGIDSVILEADRRVGDVWRRRYDSLRLYSPAKGNALPGLAFPLSRNEFPTGRQMGDYLEAYATHHSLPVRTGVRVAELSADGGTGDGAGFRITTSDGTLLADQVVVATGAFRQPRVPDIAAQLSPSIRQIHAHDYRGPEQLAEGPVLVVGLSHSGADLAYEAANAGHVTILSGRVHGELPFPIDSWRGRNVAWPLIRFLAATLLNLRTPIGRRMAAQFRKGGAPLLRVRRPELLAAGVDLRTSRTTGARDGRPVLDDGTALDVANVIWCTGYRPDFGWIHPSIVGGDGWPAQRRGVVESAPGLYVLGVPFLFSFASMLVAGAATDARYVVERLAARATATDGGPARAEASSSPV